LRGPPLKIPFPSQIKGSLRDRPSSAHFHHGSRLKRGV
jgi:hypothetical protein